MALAILAGPLEAKAPVAPGVETFPVSDLTALREAFAHPPREAGPWVYWFWFDNVVSRGEITRELEEMAEAGIGGVELRCVSMRGFSGGSPGPWFDPDGWTRLGQKKLEYLAPEFVDVLEHTLEEARRLGLSFAINLGMGWPPGGRWITAEHRSRHLVTRAEVREGPGSLAGRGAVSLPREARVSAWRLVDERTVDPASYHDLTSHVDASGQLQWEVPPGRWLIGVFETRPGGLVDKGEGPELDPASEEAVLFHLNEMFGRLEPQLGHFFGSTFVDVATDSWEYAHPPEGGRYWSPALLRKAPDVLGSALEPRMHALLGYGPDVDEVLFDLERLERELVHRHYFGTVDRFVHERGLEHRPQVYGRGLERDLLTAYALVDIPEIEEGASIPEAVWAARVLGKPVVSAEAFTHASVRHGNLRHDGQRGGFVPRTDPSKMWHTTPGLLRGLSNAHFARGINRIQIHSFSYSPPGVPDPGWRMYAEIHLNRNVPWWPELGGFARWVARNQVVLQAGVPVADALVYPVEPNPVDGPFNVIPDQPWSAENAVDGAHADLLSRLVDERGAAAYPVQRVVLRGDIRTLAEADDLLALVRAGVPVWCGHSLPGEWTALLGSDESVAQVRAALERPAEEGGLVDARSQGWEGVVEAGRSVRWPESALLSFQHRQVGEAHVYFVASWEEPFAGDVTFPHETVAPELWDADTGRMSPLKGRSAEGGRTAVSLQLEANDSRIIVFAGRGDREKAAAPEPRPEASR
jgi:hypothetical protein